MLAGSACAYFLYNSVQEHMERASGTWIFDQAEQLFPSKVRDV